MHTSPFVSSDPILLKDVESSKEYDSKDSLHFCEDERSSSSLIEFVPLPNGLESIVLDHDREQRTLGQWKEAQNLVEEDDDRPSSQK